MKADERKKTRQKIMAIIKKNSKLLVSGIMLGGSIGAILLNIPMVKLGADALYIFSMLGDASSWADAGNKLETFFRNLFTPATPEKA